MEEGDVLNSIFQNRLIRNNKNCIVVTTGPTGCLSGDTEVKISRAKNTKTWQLRDLYIKSNGLGMIAKNGKLFDLSIPLFIRSYNGEEIKLHKIKKVLYSGKKNVSLLTLANGLTIKATSDHKIMTQNGWVELTSLKIGDLVMCDTPNAEAKNRKRIKLRDIGLCVGKNHPYNIQPNKQIPVHILIYEAGVNSLGFTEYLDILLNEHEQCKNLIFINPKKYVIHHRDGNHYNNNLENLEKIKPCEHKLRHNNYSNFSQGEPKFSEVKDIKFVGEEDTYDISCEEPYHNFVANNIVVHNSAKSYSNMRIAELWYQKRFNEPFPIENICFGILALFKRIRDKENPIRKGELLILEEAGTSAGALDFQSRTAKVFSGVLQSFRSLNICLMMNLPYFTMLNKQARELVHIQLETITIDTNEKKSYLKPFQMQINTSTGKLYRHFPKVVIDGTRESIQFISYGLPSKELCEKYEENKQDFVLQNIDDGIKTLEEIDAKKQPAEKPLPRLQQAIWDLWQDGVVRNKDIAAKLMITPASVSDSMKLMRKKGLLPPKVPYSPSTPQI